MCRRAEITDFFRQLQSDIAKQLEDADGIGSFRIDEWARPGGGGGVSRVMSGGRIIEKGGVNFSAVWGKATHAMLHSLRIPATEDMDFYATGVSIVMHPNHPYVPIIHMNVRYFEMDDAHWWFGGGIDLTPHYVDEAQAKLFHAGLKEVCDKHHPSYYQKFKEWADDYFFIPHRSETRGVGGIFFDHLKDTEDFTKVKRFNFVQDVGRHFAPTYAQLIHLNEHKSFTEREVDWQYHRRGRYVEFNLVYDRGTKFGLETDGRTESILMSLPPHARWSYNHKTIKGSPEQATLNYLKKGIQWI